MRNFKTTEQQAHDAAELAVFEWLSGHEGHGISREVWRDVRALVDREVLDAAFESRRGMSFGEMLQLARVIADALFARLLDDWGEGGLALVLPGPEDDRGSGGAAVVPEHEYPAVDIDELRGLACAVAARVCWDARNREEAIAAAVDDGFLYAWQHYDPTRGSLEAWVAVCARYQALTVVRKGAITDGRERLDESVELRLEGSLKVSEIDGVMMEVMDGLASTGLTSMEHAAYIRHRFGLPAGDTNQRDALKRAKKKLRTMLEQSGYGYEDFFMAA